MFVKSGLLSSRNSRIPQRAKGPFSPLSNSNPLSKQMKPPSIIGPLFQPIAEHCLNPLYHALVQAQFVAQHGTSIPPSIQIFTDSELRKWFHPVPISENHRVFIRKADSAEIMDHTTRASSSHEFKHTTCLIPGINYPNNLPVYAFSLSLPDHIFKWINTTMLGDAEEMFSYICPGQNEIDSIVAQKMLLKLENEAKESDNYLNDCLVSLTSKDYANCAIAIPYAKLHYEIPMTKESCQSIFRLGNSYISSPREILKFSYKHASLSGKEPTLMVISQRSELLQPTPEGHSHVFNKLETLAKEPQTVSELLNKGDFKRKF